MPAIPPPDALAWTALAAAAVTTLLFWGGVAHWTWRELRGPRGAAAPDSDASA